VPREAKGVFAVVAPGLVGVWALGGFYLSLGPSLAAQILHSENLLWGGVLIFLLTGLGAAASAAFRKADPPTVMLGGCLALVAGALVTFAAIETTMPAVLLVGTAMAGLGFGPAFMGAYRSLVALAPSDDRAGLITAVYLVGYAATAVPAVVAGVATSRYGLHDTARVYSLFVAALAVVGAGSFLGRRIGAAGRPKRGVRYPDPPPGPCTAPPCLATGPAPSRS
jgi:MFS family permease